MPRKPVKIKQHDITDCGAACLASISAYYRLRMPISRIRQYASTGLKGTSALGMVRAAEQMGFTAKGVRGSRDSLREIPTPAIAHCVIDSRLHHYLVIYAVNKNKVDIMDPADGQMHKMNHDEFLNQWSGILILLLPSEQFQSANLVTSPFLRFWHLIRPHRLILTQILAGSIVYSLLTLTTAVYVQNIIDYVFIDGDSRLLNIMSLMMIFLLGMQTVIDSGKNMAALQTGQMIDAALILNYYRHLMSLPKKFFDTMRIGEIISRFNDAVKIRSFLNSTAIDLVVNALILTFSFLLMFLYSWKLGMIFSLILPLYIMVYLFVNRINKKYQREIMETAASMESQLVESISSMTTIKTYGMEQHAYLKTESRFIRLLHPLYISGKNMIFSLASSDFLSRFFTILLLWIGSVYVLRGTLSPGRLMSIYALIGFMTRPVISLLQMNVLIQDALIASDRLYEIMDLEAETNPRHVAFEKQLTGDIQFKNITFHYQSRLPLYSNLNLTIRDNSITAIVGESGSGKSTLISLLHKMYKADQGQIWIGNDNIEYIPNQSLRSAVGVVPQKIDLFTGSVLENIVLNNEEPDMETMTGICQSLGLLDLIESLPMGFHTEIGENGSSLSGGERQKIAIARALYRNPGILIFDEATASLDAISENSIHRFLHQLKREGKTILLISHRMHTVIHSDQIIVMKQGQVAEQGTHQTLYHNRSHYYTLWTHQHPEIQPALQPQSMIDN